VFGSIHFQDKRLRSIDIQIEQNFVNLSKDTHLYKYKTHLQREGDDQSTSETLAHEIR